MRSRRLPADREKFPLSLPTTPRFEICQTSGQKNFPLTHYYTRRRAKWPGSQPGNKKAANLFQDLLLSLSAGGRLVFCLKHGEGRAALHAVRPLITHQQRRAGLSTAAHFICAVYLAVDRLGWLCYLPDKWEVTTLATECKTAFQEWRKIP